jgi:hypothetical protein
MRDPVMQFWAQVVQDRCFLPPRIFHRALVRRRAAVMASSMVVIFSFTKMGLPPAFTAVFASTLV